MMYKSLYNTGDLSFPGTEAYQFDSCTAVFIPLCKERKREAHEHICCKFQHPHTKKEALI
jgi:hypothetical protein